MNLQSTLLATSFFAVATCFGNFLPNLVRRGDINKSPSRASSGRISPGLNHGPFWLARIASKATSSEDKSVASSGTCGQPCQRIPHLIKFQHALIMNGVEFEIGSLMTSKNVDENGFIDVGRCVGSCRKVESHLIRGSHLACVATKYESLQTDIKLGNEEFEGPQIEGFVIKDCGCSAYSKCA